MLLRSAFWALILLISPASHLPSLAQNGKRQVIVIAVRGASLERINEYLARGVLPKNGGFAELLRRGSVARKFNGIRPGLTSVAPASFLTGTYPDKHGITGNVFHRNGTQITTDTFFSVFPYQSETLDEAAVRQGLKTVNIGPIHAAGSIYESPMEIALLGGEQISQPKVLQLGWDGSPAWASDGSERIKNLKVLDNGSSEIETRLGESFSFTASAIDNIRDNRKQYGEVVLRFPENKVVIPVIRLKPGEWANIRFTGERNAGISIKLLKISQDLSEIRLYISGAQITNSKGPAFSKNLKSQAGAFPGFMDEQNFRRGLIDEHTYREQGERLAEFKKNAAVIALKTENPDLLVYDEHVIDNISHPFFLVDKRQPGFMDDGGAKRLRYDWHIEQAYKKADSNLKEIMIAARPGAAFIVSSPYVISPVYEAISVRNILEKAGLKISDDISTEARAFTYGPVSHIRFSDPAKSGIWASSVIEEALSLRHPNTGNPLIDKALRRSELGQFRLEHPENTGDVVLFAAPGYVLSNLPVSANPQPRFSGDHGWMSDAPGGDGFLIISGAGARRIARASGIDIPATASALLGIKPPSGNEGKPIR